jgi:hypothetical protein
MKENISVALGERAKRFVQVKLGQMCRILPRSWHGSESGAIAPQSNTWPRLSRLIALATMACGGAPSLSLRGTASAGQAGEKARSGFHRFDLELRRA